MTDRVGILFSTRDDPSLVSMAEARGYESAWAAEGQGKAAFGKLERWAGATETIGLATGIVNVYSRTPAAVAQSIATLDDHSGGRAILGLGVAHPGVVEEFHGATFDRPLARMREYIELVRKYLAGDAAAYDGEFFTPTRPSFWPQFDPVRAEIPIYNAALGPKNVQLTGEFADGWLPNLYPVPQFESALERLEAGARRADRNSEDVDVAMYVLAAVDEDRARAMDAARAHVAYYVRDIPGYYSRAAKRAGFEDAVAAIQNAATSEAAAREVPDSLVEEVAVAGTPEEAREQLDSLRNLGVDLPIVRAPIGADREDVERTIRTFAPRS